MKKKYEQMAEALEKAEGALANGNIDGDVMLATQLDALRAVREALSSPTITARLAYLEKLEGVVRRVAVQFPAHDDKMLALAAENAEDLQDREDCKTTLMAREVLAALDGGSGRSDSDDLRESGFAEILEK